MQGQQYNFSKNDSLQPEFHSLPRTLVSIDTLTADLENQKLAAAYEIASIAIDEYFNNSGKERPEDIQF